MRAVKLNVMCFMPLLVGFRAVCVSSGGDEKHCGVFDPLKAAVVSSIRYSTSNFEETSGLER